MRAYSTLFYHIDVQVFVYCVCKVILWLKFFFYLSNEKIEMNCSEFARALYFPNTLISVLARGLSKDP